MVSLFKERLVSMSSYMKFSQSDAEPAKGEFDSEVPQLSYLRIELQRVHPGMSDYIVRIASPKYDNVKSNTILSIRGNRGLIKYENLKKISSMVQSEMENKEDKTFDWATLDVDNLTDMLVAPVKFFSVNTNVQQLRLTTEALSSVSNAKE